MEDKNKPQRRSKSGYILVFCDSFRHHKTGKRIYRKDGRKFRFWVKPREPKEPTEKKD